MQSSKCVLSDFCGTGEIPIHLPPSFLFFFFFCCVLESSNMGKKNTTRTGGKSSNSKSQALPEEQLLSIAMRMLRQRLSQSTLPACIHGYHKEHRLGDFLSLSLYLKCLCSAHNYE